MSIEPSGSTQMVADTDPCTIEESYPPAQSALMSPASSPTRIKTLAPLLKRENVNAILSAAGIESVTVTIKFLAGGVDSKRIRMADGGSLALLLLEDNPDGIAPGAFYDIRPA